MLLGVIETGVNHVEPDTLQDKCSRL